MTNNEYSTRFHQIVQFFISSEHFDSKSESYTSFIHFLCNSKHSSVSEIPEQHFKSNIENLFFSAAHINDKTKRIRLYLIGLDVLLNLNYDDSSNSTALQFNRIYQSFEDYLQLLGLLLKCPGVLHADKEFGSTFYAYSKLAEVIRKIYTSFDVSTVTNFEETILSLHKQDHSINSIFVLGVLSEKYQSFRSKVIQMAKNNILNYSQSVNLMLSDDRSKPQSEIPRYLLLAISCLACGYAIQFVQEGESEPENASNPFSVDSLKKLILTLFQIKSFVFVPQCAIFFMSKLLTYFKPEKALHLFTQDIVTCIQNLFRAPEPTTKLLFNLISNIPIGQESPTSTSMGPFTLSIQLTNLLPYMSLAIKHFDNEYNDLIMEFIEKRKDDHDFPKLVEELASRDSTYKAAIVISVKLKMLNNTVLLNKLFPDVSLLLFDPSNSEASSTPELIFESIPYLGKNGLLNGSNIDVICKSIFGILSTQSITQNRIEQSLIKDLESCLLSMKSFIIVIFDNFVKYIANFTTAHGISIICNFFNTNLVDLQSDVDYSVDFCNCVATLLRYILATVTPDDFKDNFFKFIEMFSRKIGHTINQIDEEQCKSNAYKFISTFVPQKLQLTLLNQSYQLIDTKDLSYSIICVAIPGIDENHYNNILSKVNKQLNSELFALVYSTRAHISSSGTLNRLYEFTKSSQSGWFKKAPPPEFYKSVMAAVTLILEKNVIPEKEMEILMKTLELSIPKNVDILYKVRHEAKQMIRILSLRHNAKPSKSFVNHLIGIPLYADYLPGLISKVPSSDEQIKDAVQSWALHTFEDPLTRQQNPEFVESVFKYPNNENTLNSIINILIQYMGSSYSSESTYENDPINAIELAASAAEIGRNHNIRYTKHSVLLLLKCSEYLLSSGDELRIATTKFLINLFNLNINDDILMNYNKPMSPNDIIECFMSLFRLILGLLNEADCINLFDQCVSSYPLQLHHVYLIRVLLSVHSSTFVEKQVAPLIKLFTFKASKLDATIAAQIEQAILFFAQDNIAAFTNFLCHLPLNELTTLCVNRLLMKTKLRNQFINEYATVLSNSYTNQNDILSNKNGLYQLLSVIASSNINNDFSGQLICCCLIWIGIFFFVKLMKISTSSYSSELKSISMIFSKLVNSNSNTSSFFGQSNTTYSPFANLSFVNFSISDVNSFVDNLNLAANQILNALDIEQFDEFLEISFKCISTSSSAAIISIGVVFIQLLQRYSLYPSSTSQKYFSRVIEIILTCLNKSSLTNEKAPTATKEFATTRILAFALNSSINYEILKQISPTNQKNILTFLLLNCIHETNKSSFLIKEAFDLVCWLVINLNSEIVVEQVDLVKQFATVFFNLCSFNQNNQEDLLRMNMAIINVLDFLSSTNCEFVGKMGQSRLCYINLLMLMTSSKQRADLQLKICEVLKKLTSSKDDDEMFDKILKTKIDQNEMKVLCGNLFKVNTNQEGKFVDVRLLNDKYFRLLWHVYQESFSYRHEVVPFHNEVFRVFSTVIAVFGSNSTENMDEMHKNSLEIAIKGLQQM